MVGYWRTGDYKKELQEAVEWPLKYQELFTHPDATPPELCVDGINPA
jgi:SpoVK/Ycf46/Vps4 family AAA+-type ATPase